ncbi:(d)CMP kinase [Leptospira sp. GIMC2001]|uniref:(d)CMP kinase n=1 Tax=Leptospira sp. GIMC2001 TaxID=1513297 RepID=UPI00234B99B2|nr:(d)CMP kinase [Leptospira sp. GIMC2001]WCL48719.1 (d)CMP kinase [Leptospira sp. GIMC2001]
MDYSNEVIAIDGPAGSGKSTVAREIGKILGIEYLDSGAFYRALTLALFNIFELSNESQSFPDWTKVAEQELDLSNIDIRLHFGEGKENRIFLNNVDVSQDIRTPQITEKIKFVADKRRFRDFVNERIRDLATKHKLVMDGRDIGTEVFPNSRYKFFLTASPKERANRRFAELQAKNVSVNWDDVFHEMVERDNSDKNREIAPLVQAKDAILIDTDERTIKLVIETILSGIQEAK